MDQEIVERSRELEWNDKSILRTTIVNTKGLQRIASDKANQKRKPQLFVLV
ncbi:MAG: hypothetical protein KBF93_17820 [Leptospiraceae bacterium]|nr:hypothetical protein [Leptospiraceae bacterium]